MAKSSRTRVSCSTTRSFATLRAFAGVPGASTSDGGNVYVTSPASWSCSTRCGSCAVGGGRPLPASQRREPGVGGVVRGVVIAAGQMVVQVTQPLRDLVHGRRGDDQQPEEGQQQEQRHRGPRRHRVGERRGGEEPDDAA